MIGKKRLLPNLRIETWKGFLLPLGIQVPSQKVIGNTVM